MSRLVDCPPCGGTGAVRALSLLPHPRLRQWVARLCPVCHGRGTWITR